jgi:nucleoside-diphosphate-sugar epimerase
VTGAAGFVGSRVARSLVDQGLAVHGVVREPGAPRLRELSGVRIECCDLRDPGGVAELVERVAPERCIHCAWIATPGEYLLSPENDVHVAAAEELGKALVAAGCSRLVGLGTCFEYAPSDAPLAESSPLEPSTPYARAKVATMERLARICEGTTMAFAWARLFYLYGPHEDPRRLVPAITLALLDGRTAPTTGGEQLRDFLHVDDVARALVAVASSELTGAVNIGSGHAVTVREVVETIGRLTGRSDLLEIGVLPYAPGDPMVVVADTTRLTREVGWEPTLTLEDGLRQTVASWDRAADG